jgi:FHA domain
LRTFGIGLVAGGAILVAWATHAAAAKPVELTPFALPLAGADVGIELVAQAFAWLNGHVQAILVTAYDRAPVLVVVMATLLIVPLTALVALLAHGLRLRVLRGQRSPRPVDQLATSLGKPLPRATPEAALWPQTAWLEFDAGTQGRTRLLLPRAQGLVRIGRHEDNDIRLPFSTVHRHHALIHRTPTAEFVITDLSGREGNGVMINGEKRAEARLAPGDMIVLGDARLRFDSAPL